jgi:hypothetical protein
MSLRFSPWFPLVPDAIDANAPDEPGVFEVRVYGPLLVYSKGRSAMVLYGGSNEEHTTVRAALRALTARGLPDAVRAAIGSSPVYFRTAQAAKPRDELRRRLADFQMRFGGHPLGNT